MRKTAYRKDILRTITHGKKRFCSIMVITALGVIMLTGLRAACVDLRKSADSFFDAQNLYDIMIQSTLGLTDDDVEVLEALEGVSQAEGGYSETVYLTGDSHEQVLIKTISPTGMSEPYVVEGTLPAEADEIAVTQNYLTDTGKGLGDTVTIEEIEDDEDDEDEEAGYETAEGSDEASDAEDKEDDGDSISIEVDIDTSALEEDEDTPTFPNTEFTITAVVIDPADINNPDGSTTFRISSTTDYTFFVLPEAVDSDIYTAVYLTVDGAAALNCYTDAYEDAVAAVIDEIELLIKEEREDARTQSVIDEAQEKIDDAEETMNEAFAEVDAQIADAEDELADARTELDDAWEEIEDGFAEIEDGQQEIDDGWDTLAEEEQEAADQIEDARNSLASADRQLTSAWAELKENEALLEEAQAELDAGIEELTAAQEEAEAQIAEGRAALEEAESQLETTLAELEEQLSQIKAQLPSWPSDEFDALRAAAAAGEDTDEAAEDLTTALSSIVSSLLTSAGDGSSEAEDGSSEETDSSDEYGYSDEGLQAQMEMFSALIESVPGLAIGLGQVDAALAEIAAQYEALEAQEAAAEAQFEAAWAEIYENQAVLDAAFEELEDGKAELKAAQAQLDAADKTLNEQEELAQEEFAQAKEDLLEAQAELDDGLAELYDGLAELEDGEEEYAEGAGELADGIATYQEERSDAEEQLADAKAELADLDEAVWYVQDRTSLSGYTNIDSDSGAIEAIGNAFPVIFLAVAILISLTTVTRMVEEERGLIGTYKALGFSDGQILSKYLIFAVAACLMGSLLGEAGGFVLLPEIVFIIFGTMYSLPAFTLSFDLFYGLLGPVIFLAGIGIATWFACKSALKQTPAILMRPKSPSAGSKVFLEHIPFIWKHFSFLNKVTARNLFRYKKRLCMTVAGILGCTALLVCGFAIKDTVSELMPRQYEEVYKYDLLVVADDNDDLLDIMDSSEEIEDYLNIQIDTVTVEYDGSRMSVQMYIVPDGDVEAFASYITLDDTDGASVLPDDTGILITRNAGQILGFSAGDSVYLQDLALTQVEVDVTALLQNFLGNGIYVTQSMYEQLFGGYEANAVLASLDESVEDPAAFAEELSHQDGITSATATQQLKDEFSQAFVLINMVVYIIIIMAAALAFVVLFTLSTTNISEREREIATIKVLGFFDREVHLYVNKETLILTVFGILPGLPLGSLLGHAMTVVLNMPSLYFAVSIYKVSFLYSGGLALLFALIVQQITNRVLNHINPVEALKSIE